MSIGNCPIGIDGYVSRYIDKNGCTFEQACKDLGVNCDDVFKVDDYISKEIEI